MILVLDASAVIAMLRNEQGGRSVSELIDDSENTCYAHAVNLCEIYYGMRREKGEDTAHSAVADLSQAGVTEREDMDSDFWLAAGRLKADLARISLADCMCVALANRLNGQVVTADHREFDRVVELGRCPVRFIR